MFHYKYIQLVLVRILHPFYRDSISRDFSFSALPGTDSLLKAYGLKPRFDNGELRIYQQQEGDGTASQPIDSVLDLYFTIDVKTDILNITAAPTPANYWFSNLKKNGSYNDTLTAAATLTTEDKIDGFGGQTFNTYFEKGTLSKIDVMKIVPQTGLQVDKTYAIDVESSEQKIVLSKSGYYTIEKFPLVAGAVVQKSKLFLCDEPINKNNLWAFLHLQIVPGIGQKSYQIVLPQLKTFWQYLVMIPRSRTSDGVITEFLYSKTDPRYPDATFAEINPPVNSPLKIYIDETIADTGTGIKKIYVYQSNLKIGLFDGEPPDVSVTIDAKKSEKIATPNRTMAETKILYKI
jgi:hypothetical protein